MKTRILGIGLIAFVTLAPTRADAAITGIEWPEISDSGCFDGAGSYRGGTFDGELCYTRPSSGAAGTLGLTATYTKGGSLTEFEAWATVGITKAAGGAWSVTDMYVTVTVDGTAYDVPVDARGDLDSSDLTDLISKFVSTATDLSDRFSPRTTTTLGWATFPSWYALEFGEDYPVSFSTGADRFDGTMSLCVCDLAEVFELRGTWADGRETVVTAEITQDPATGHVVISNWTDDWLAPVGVWTDDWLAPVLRGVDLDDAVTKATRIAVSRSITQ